MARSNFQKKEHERQTPTNILSSPSHSLSPLLPPLLSSSWESQQRITRPDYPPNPRFLFIYFFIFSAVINCAYFFSSHSICTLCESTKAQLFFEFPLSRLVLELKRRIRAVVAFLRFLSRITNYLSTSSLPTWLTLHLY